jgi:hypothetical protein
MANIALRVFNQLKDVPVKRVHAGSGKPKSYDKPDVEHILKQGMMKGKP